MPKTLAHPTASPTTDIPVFGDILTGGGAVPAGKTKIGQPVSNYGFTGLIWVPQGMTAGGSALVDEYNAQAILDGIRNLLAEMEQTTAACDATEAQLRILTGLGSALQAHAVMPAQKSLVDGTGITASATRQGMAMAHNLAQIAFDCQRKYVGTDGSAYVSPAAINGAQVTFTGVSLFGRTYLLFNATDRMYHSISNVVDPAGGAVGTFQVSPLIPSANAVLRIPYTSTPHAWNSAADAFQTIAVAGDPPRINGPAMFISQTAATDNGSYQWPLPCSMYGRHGFEIIWTANGGSARTLAWHVFGKVNDGAWAAPGAIPAVYNIDTQFAVTAGSTAWGAAAGTGAIEGRLVDPGPYNSICFEVLVAADDANTTTITAWFTMYGGTK